MPRNKKRKAKTYYKQEDETNNKTGIFVKCRRCSRELTHYKAHPGQLCRICTRLQKVSRKRNSSISQADRIQNQSKFDSRVNNSSYHSERILPSETWERRIYNADSARNSPDIHMQTPHRSSDESFRTARFKTEIKENSAYLHQNHLTYCSQMPKEFVYQNPTFSYSTEQIYRKQDSGDRHQTQEIYPSFSSFDSLHSYQDSTFTTLSLNENSIMEEYSGNLLSKRLKISPNVTELNPFQNNQTVISHVSTYPKLKRRRQSKNVSSKRPRSSLNQSSTPQYDVSSKISRSTFNVSSTPQFDQLNTNIWNHFRENIQTEDIFTEKMKLRYKLQSIVEQKFIDCGLFVFGSSMTGFATKSSDVDICLMFHNIKIPRNRVFRILWDLRSLFSKHPFLSNFQVIRAKVPIIKFCDRISGFEVDMNINNPTGVRNSQLLRSYARIDERVRPLILAAKFWARVHNINDAKTGSLSSYSLGLMIIHYLQYGCSPPVLPALQVMQPDKYHPDSDIRNLELDEELPFFKSQNTQSVGQLFVGFLHYYSEIYDFERCRISVRLGTLLPREDIMLNKDKTFLHWIDIEEPFELTNTARSVNMLKNALHIKSVFDNSYNLVSQQGYAGLL